ncbi:MAG TPA: UDP-N-acetylmuramoyl-L-alanyl-D-glutamate--2,6-diaminopimelate ligase [Desulfotomaculum sp.]|nr:UDP-N-acetylmuramoyl-L-alanyl-D-glutamate--2,6-diaminopimelate ligase [Desulfotomaculum sp.]
MLFSELIEEQKILAKSKDLQVPVRGLAYDSRSVGQDFLFFAVEGFKTDGHLFIEKAIENGASAVVIQKPVNIPENIAWIQVPDTRSALALFSARYYGNPTHKLKLIGVTGTNGKTTTTHLLAAIYRSAGDKTGIIGTISNWIGDLELPVDKTTPESLELQQLFSGMAQEGVKTVVMEVSSHALALRRVVGCRFKTALFTNISQDHLDFHQDMDDYLRTKAMLFKMLSLEDKSEPRFAIVNYDDPGAREILAASQVDVVTYGLGEKAMVRATEVEVTSKGVSFLIITPWGESRVALKLTGLFNVYNALAALAAGGADGLTLEAMIESLQSVSGVRGRFEKVDRGQDYTVVVDYAHTPDGLEKVLKTAREITSGKLISVFGCGGDRDRGKRPLMGEIAARLCDLAVVTSDNPRTEDPLKIITDVQAGMNGISGIDYVTIPDRRQAIAYALGRASAGDVVVIAGKGHEDYQIIGNRKFPFDDREEVIKVLEKNKGC